MSSEIKSQQVMEKVQELHLAEIISLTFQFIITLHTTYNLKKNKEQFPVKQLSPLLSFAALLSFLLLNLISFSTKLIQQQNHYYHPEKCGDCRLYSHPQMIMLAFLYNGLRQLPLIIFILKTYRVCLCYSQQYHRQLPKILVKIFRSQTILLFISVILTMLLMLAGFLVFDGGNEQNGYLIFQFFCPKESGIYDWIVTALRFVGMAYVYSISIYTYTQLDSKRFLLLIFSLTNTEVILRLSLFLGDITKTTYHEFYYHSFFMNLFGSIILFFYSNTKEKRNGPLGRPILENFNGFLQTSLGYSVLLLFAQYLDQKNHTKRYTINFLAYIKIDEFNMLSSQEDFDREQYQKILNQIQEVLRKSDILAHLEEKNQLIRKCQQKVITAWQLKYAQALLSDFCQKEIFIQWRKTQSSQYLQEEFKKNGVINMRMQDLGIQL